MVGSIKKAIKKGTIFNPKINRFLTCPWASPSSSKTDLQTVNFRYQTTTERESRTILKSKEGCDCASFF